MPFDYCRLKIFAHLNAEKAPLYRATMALFLEAKAHFEIHLRPDNVSVGLQQFGEFQDDSAAEVEGALTQLCDWGNLRRTQDTSDVRTVEEFYRPRYLYQLTREGEAAERAVRAYQENILKPGELQTAALVVIREQLQALLAYTRGPELDASKIHFTLSNLKSYFNQLTTKAQVFIGSIQRAIDLHGYELDVFIVYKEKLIEYLERFIGELVIAADEIADIIRKLEQVGIHPILRVAAEHDLVDAMGFGEDEVAKAEREWMLRWAGLKKWFISGVDSPSQADMLRSCARSAIPSLLIAISGLHDRRAASSDRPTDLKLLARWFALTDCEADAHRLWRTAFALNPARHLRIDDSTMDVCDQQPIPATTSWLEAPPIMISPRLRRIGQQHRRGRPANVIDRTEAKNLLAALAKQEAEQVEFARRRFVAGRVMRLSELGQLNRCEFQLFLDLLGKALAEQKDIDAEVVTTSCDGSLQITLKPTEQNEYTTIVTSDGDFHGRDHYIYVIDLTNADPLPLCNGSVNCDDVASEEIYETAGQGNG